MAFIDEIKIYVKAGDGGSGASSFRREKFLPLGGPDGGNGGKGGSIILRAVKNINTLLSFRYNQHVRAENGENGRGNTMYGAHGRDTILNVPVGTQVFEDQGALLGDLCTEEETLVVAIGGRGGAGNACFKSSINRAPRKFLPGEEGEEKWIRLKLKIIADVGIIGLPNAGKSTFLSLCSKARPKIADYPFTTLVPQLGVVDIGYDSFIIADIPGLIEGASQGSGLGDKFLKHIERCRALLHLVDATNIDVLKTYYTVREELALYNSTLLEKAELVVLSKSDLLTPAVLNEKLQSLKNAGIQGITTFSFTDSTETISKELYKLIN